MEIRYFFRMIQRGWWLIVISLLLAANLSLVNSFYFAKPQYESVARFIVSPNIEVFGDLGKDLANSLETLDKRSIVATYAEVIKSREIFENTINLLGGESADFVDYESIVVVLPEANIIQMTVRGPDPEVAAFLANSVGQYALEFINELYKVYSINFIDKAVVNETPYTPRPVPDFLISIVIGLTVGFGLVFLQDQLTSSLQGISIRRMKDAESTAFTRIYFERRLREEIASNPESDLSLGFLYLNGIQDIYDSLPQAYINQIMRKVNDTLQFQLRGNDIVGRWSTMHFSILLPTTPGMPAERTLARIRDILAQPFSLDSGSELNVELDPRIGVAARMGQESFGDLVDHAENALEIAMQSEKKINLYRSSSSPGVSESI